MKLFAFLALLITPLSFAALPEQLPRPEPEEIRDELNDAPYGARVQFGTQIQSKKIHVLEALYDFNRQGGAVGTVSLLDAKDFKKAYLPAGAIVKDCVILVDKALTSTGSATVSFSTGQREEDVKSIAAKTAFTTTDGLVGCQIANSASTSVKLGGYTDHYSSNQTKRYTPSMKIGTAALDGGHLRVWLSYILNR